MLDLLKESFQRLLAGTDTSMHRYLFDSFNIKNRLTGMIGPRGVGKTTLMLQFIKEKLKSEPNIFYVSADHLFFSSHTLLAFVDELYHTEGIDHFFFDEIHKYPNWNQELKNIYDSYPKIKIIFSGSSSIDLIKGSYDLSRRTKIFRLYGLSFREYLLFTTGILYPQISLEHIIKHPHEVTATLAKIPKLKGHFKDYLLTGYYPFLFEDQESYSEKLLTIIDKSIYEDIAKFYNLKTQNLVYFKKILNFFASIPPGETNINNIAKNIGVDYKTIEHYLWILSEAGLVRFVYAHDGGSRGLPKPAKIFINNTTLLKVINESLGEPISIGNLRELFFLQSLSNAGLPVFYSNIGDYQSGEYFFEIGGKNKKQKRNHPKTYLIKDDILHPGHHELPLYLFGFLY